MSQAKDVSEERIIRLEERMAWLERHVMAQDKAMLEQARRLDRVIAELGRLQARAGHEIESAERAGLDLGVDGTELGGARLADERPPHY
jgi:SlyX protein